MLVLRDPVGAAERARDGGDEKGAEINAQNNAGGGEGAVVAGDDDVRHHAIEDFLDLRIGRQKARTTPSILWSFAGSVPKRPRRCQRKRRPGAKREKELVGHLGGETHRLVGGGLPDEPT